MNAPIPDLDRVRTAVRAGAVVAAIYFTPELDCTTSALEIRLTRKAATMM
jgi:hypothetical protein